jgi:hypothetical protein
MSSSDLDDFTNGGYRSTPNLLLDQNVDFISSQNVDAIEVNEKAAF